MKIKRITASLLLVAMLLGCCMGIISCTKNKIVKPEDGVNARINQNEILIDIATASVPSGLASTSEQTKTAANSIKWTPNQPSTARFPISKTDLTGYKELSFWIYSTSDVENKSTNVRLSLLSDDPGVASDDYYYVDFTVLPGWNQYNIPFAEITSQSIGYPIGMNYITDIQFSARSGNSSSSKIYFDSFYLNTERFGTLAGLKVPEVENAVCFYEYSNAYLYDQLRFILSEDEKIATQRGSNTTFVPIEILAEHRGATNITATKDKVSFSYDGKEFSFDTTSQVSFTGHADGRHPGKVFQVNPITVQSAVNPDGYLMFPMEYCAEILEYKLFYNEMGLAVFYDGDDTKKLYDYGTDISHGDFEKCYHLVEVIAFNKYTGEEMLENMNSIHDNKIGEDSHGRLMVTSGEFEVLKNLIKTDPVYMSWFKRFENQYGIGSNYFNSAFLARFDLGDGYRLLGMSRDVMEHIMVYSTLYKLTGNQRYAEKVRTDVNNLCKFTDPMTKTLSWHPEHFLDTGEIMYAISIAYDWLYDFWSADDKKRIESAVMEMGYGAAMGFGALADWWSTELMTELPYYPDGTPILNSSGNHVFMTVRNYNIEVFNWETRKITPEYAGYLEKAGYTYSAPYPNGLQRVPWTNNWNGVCNGGMTAMAFAFANVDADFYQKSATLLDCIMHSVVEGLKDGYAPDGGYPEGPGYWSYGSTYTAILFASIQSSVGTTFGLINAPGFRESFYFIAKFAAMSDWGVWDYHDAHYGRPDNRIYFWFARESGDSNIGGLRYELIMSGVSSIGYWDILFYRTDNVTTDIDLPLDNVYYGIATVTFRDSWTNNSMFAGLHGGFNNVPHNQLDIGNFIVEWGGVRYFRDLGADEYNLVAYNGNRVTYFSHPYREWFYRMRAEGHNTLVINPKAVNTSIRNGSDSEQGKNYDQKLNGNSVISAFESGPNAAYAVVTLYNSNAANNPYYETTAGSIRGMWVTDNRKTIIVQDELYLNTSSDVVWNGHVQLGCGIKVSADGKSALVTYQGKTLLCEIIVPEGSTPFYFYVSSATYLPETGLITQADEYDRTGFQKLIARSGYIDEQGKAVSVKTTTVKLAVVMRLLENGPANYTYRDIKDWYVY